jgi:hypothetical protein
VICRRLYGGSARDCECRLPAGGWAECPPPARRVIPRVAPPSLSGDLCDQCGSAQMIRAGTCLLCLNCGTSEGCG